MRRPLQDIVILSGLLVLTSAFAWFVVDFSIPPAEDAAMLMRYAEHVSQGKGVVWNIGESPCDGATDFLFMMLLAVVRAMGVSIEVAARLITVLSHFITVCLIYLGMRRKQNAGIVPAFLSAAYFAVGEGLFLSAACFGTALFVLVVAAAWLLAQRLIAQRQFSLAHTTVFALTCLIAGLVRPEGVLIAGFMLASIGILTSPRRFLQVAGCFSLVFLILGGLYFIGRWQYFGYPLPNPYYKKGAGQLYPLDLLRSLRNGCQSLYPLIPLFLLSLRDQRHMRMGVAFSIPIAGTLGMWILLSDEMNFGGRFQYPALVLGLLSWYPLVGHQAERAVVEKLASFNGMTRFAAIAASMSLLVGVFAERIARVRNITYRGDGRYDIAMILRQYADRKYTIATTEAGLLPLYSQWRTVDTWGLNDQWIAHNGVITEEYLQKHAPDMIVYYSYSPDHDSSDTVRGPWNRQVIVLRTYAQRHGFTLAAVFVFSRNSAHYYYVAAELPEHDEIVRRIRSVQYGWLAQFYRAEDRALLWPLRSQ